MELINAWEPYLIWGIVGLVLLGLEILVPIFVFLFLGIGALFTATLCLFMPLSIEVQLVVFIVSSSGAILSLRKTLLQKYRGDSKSLSKVGPKELVGLQAKVVMPISNLQSGRIFIRGAEWAAFTKEVKEYPEGSYVEIVGQKGSLIEVK